MDTSQFTILVVEDEKPLQKIIVDKLTNYGFNVKAVRSVDDALSVLQGDEKIDAIWLDHYLYGSEDGLGLVVELKNEGSSWKNIPVFVVSNTVGGDKARMYLRLGAEKFYTKSNHKLEDIIADMKEVLSGNENGESV